MVDSVVKDALEKDHKLWLVLQNMCKAYNSVGWHYLKTSLYWIKICDRFIRFFARTGKIENSGGLFSFFAAALIQYALNITSEFFTINNISINNKKTVVISINQGVNIASLSISGQSISIARKSETHRYLGIFLSTKGLSKLSVTKAHSDVCFFVNVVLKKIITDKQFSYLVSTWDAIVQKSLRSKAYLLCDFPVEALHHLLLYGLKSFEQLQLECKSAVVVSFFNAFGILRGLFNHKFLDLQILSWVLLNSLQFPVKLHISPVNNFLAGVVKIFLDNELFLANNLPSTFHSPSVFSISFMLGNTLYFSLVCLLKHFGVTFGDRLFDKKDLRDSVLFWFVTVLKLLMDVDSLLVVFVGSGLLSELNVLNSVEFSDIQSSLHEIWSDLFDIYTDSLLRDAGTVNVAGSVAAYFFSVNLSVGVKIRDLLSSTFSELQAVALALKCVLSSCAVVLHLDSQAVIDVCRHYIFNLIRDKDLIVRWVKIKSYSGVVGNMEADAAANHATCFKFSLPVGVHKHFLVAEATAISGNAYHFVRDVAMAKVWHPNFHILASFTSQESSGLHTYLMKAVHQWLPVAVKKRLYNRRYLGMLCLLCGEVELPNYVFTCALDAKVQEEILIEASVLWTSLLSVDGPAFSAVLQAFGQCSSDIGLYSVLCKRFVLRDWYEEAVNVFDGKKKAFCIIIEFIRWLAELINPAAKLRKKLGIIATPEKLLPLPLNFCPLYKGLNQNFQIQHLQNSLNGSIILQRTSTDNTKPKVAESEIIGANHLGFAKSLFQHYSFNFYVNKKISSLLETPVNTESARETFYKELIQNTNLPTNHNFASIITKINKEIEHHTQQRYPITYTSKGKGKLQTPAVTPRKLQPPAWKKNRVESLSNSSYHYTPGSVINISSTDTFSSTGFNSRSSTPSELRSPLPPPDFGISDPWETAESEKEEEESENQEFTYQNPITESPEVETPEVETPNLQAQQNLNIENSKIETQNQQRQNNPKPKLINQQNLSLIIVIDQLPINPVAEPIQQPL
ncbi:hypothetical protein G9A89_015951 [Geosiphon pyriformis]|nr:hypothetical protein G9A89_015951 [Geosiphon pyriformis]